MSNSALFALSAVDGRYASKTESLKYYFSEAGLLRYRIAVEARWLCFLAENVKQTDISFGPAESKLLNQLSDPKNLTEADLQKVKDIEAVTNHDVKACEYFLREKMEAVQSPSRHLAFLHFACTSEDINNTSYAMLVRDALQGVVLPEMKAVVSSLNAIALEHSELPMLARTHGQTASPTTLGKEIGVHSHRLYKSIKILESIQMEAKFNGAVGNYNAHAFAYPEMDWPQLSKRFIEKDLGLSWNPLTTQIENHDSLAQALSMVRHFDAVAIGLCRDIWTYISQGYFKQRVVEGEVGSSTMPHKVNPIDFENAEGNFGLASALAEHLSEKLLVSRLQRDLTDSTVLRSLGTVFGHLLIALKSLAKGIGKLQVHPDQLARDLDHAWEVLAEPVQTVLRTYGVVDAYEQLKKATRGKALDRESYKTLVNQLNDLPDAVKNRLRDLTPAKYVGLASDIVKEVIHNQE